MHPVSAKTFSMPPKNGLKIQLNANGRNAEVLEKLLNEGLGDRLIMEIMGPESLFDVLYGPEPVAE